MAPFYLVSCVVLGRLHIQLTVYVVNLLGYMHQRVGKSTLGTDRTVLFKDIIVLLKDFRNSSWKVEKYGDRTGLYMTELGFT